MTTPSVESAFSTFVTDYNNLIGDLNKQQGNDSSGNPEPLYGTPRWRYCRSSWNRR